MKSGVSGLKRIYEACKEAGVKVEFKRLKSGFSVIFYRKAEKTREKIIGLIKENHSISTKELADRTGLTIKGIEWQIKKLKDLGILKRAGPDKGGYWKVIK